MGSRMGGDGDGKVLVICVLAFNCIKDLVFIKLFHFTSGVLLPFKLSVNL